MNIKRIVIFLIIMLLFGCEQIWYFTVIDVSEPGHPRFCISRYKNCKGHGIGFSVFEIDEVNEKGKFIRTVWEIHPIKNVDISKVINGTPPHGYKEMMKAVPLEIGKIYRVHGKYFLRFSTLNNVSDILSNPFN